MEQLQNAPAFRLLLNHFSNGFPGSKREWQSLFATDKPFKPASLFPFELNLALKQRIADLFAANDRTRLRSPARDGYSTRPYEPGDALKDISRPHLLRLNELHTKLDASPGRQTASIILHLGNNMEYSSQPATSNSNKGQILLVCAGVIQLVHECASHSTNFLVCFDEQLSEFLPNATKKFINSQWVWVLSDFLEQPFDEKKHEQDKINLFPDGGVTAILDFLNSSHNRKCGVVLVRDEWELPEAAEQLAAQLVPYSPNIPQNTQHNSLGPNKLAPTKNGANSKAAQSPSTHYFANHNYLANLKAQLHLLDELTKNKNCSFVKAKSETEIESLIQELAFAVSIT